MPLISKGMVLIISNDNDVSTNDVLDWLRLFKIEHIKISSSDQIIVQQILFSSSDIHISLEIQGRTILLKDIKTVWYRRDWFNLKNDFNDIVFSEPIKHLVDRQLTSEIEAINQLIWDVFAEKSFNKPSDNNISKLSVMRQATLLNIPIPETLVTSKRHVLLAFLRQNQEAITKNFSQGVFINIDGAYFGSFTQLLTATMIEELNDTFAPILAQRMINKSFEVRTFYLDGDFYSSAIFSQDDEKTKLDFRNYNFENPNRTPPYTLPSVYQKSLHQLMTKLQLRSGSIDTLVDSAGRHYFLEVNPVGQFKQVSQPCNYSIEMTFAKKLAYESRPI